MSSASEDRAASPKRLRLGAYELLFDLATGGMATVALARQVGDAGFERLVALKRVHAHLLADPEVFAMASDEARLAALIRHPNVVPVISVLDTGGELVLVQDFVEGAILSTLLRRLAKAGERLEPAVAVKMAVDARRGLHAAHEGKGLRGGPLGRSSLRSAKGMASATSKRSLAPMRKPRSTRPLAGIASSLPWQCGQCVSTTTWT